MLTDAIIFLILLVFSAYFSGSEVALFSLSKSDLHRYSMSADGREKKLSALMAGPQKILVTILIGNLLANLMIPALSTRVLLNVWSRYGHFIAIAAVTPLIILLCDIIPKTVTRSDPQRFSKIAVPVLGIFHWVFAPVRNVLLWAITLIIRLLKIEAGEEKITEDELNMAVKVGESEGIIKREEGAFIMNVMRFSKKQAQNIMIPRNQAVFIPFGCTVEQAAGTFLDTGLVRTVVYKGDFDHVVGVLDSRELVPYIWGRKKAKTINKLMYPVNHYPSTKELGELLTDFLGKKIQIAVVIDEYGGTAGVVTLNAILSELMGREFSSFEEVYKPGIRRTVEGGVIVSGDMQIDDYNVAFDDSIASSESETIGGYITEKMEQFPGKDDSVTTDKYVLRVKRVIKNRIESIEVLPRTSGT